MTTEAESMPLADYLVSKGVDPAKASVLGAQGDSISRNRGMGELERAFTQPAAPPPAVRIQPATPDQATAALREHEQSVHETAPRFVLEPERRDLREREDEYEVEEELGRGNTVLPLDEEVAHESTLRQQQFESPSPRRRARAT